MKGTHAANVSLVLSAIGAPLIFFGFFSMLGDPAPSVSAEDISAAMFRSQVVLICGLFSIAASLWLSGYAFTAAPKRCVLAVVLCVVSVGSLWFA